MIATKNNCKINRKTGYSSIVGVTAKAAALIGHTFGAEAVVFAYHKIGHWASTHLIICASGC